VVCGHYTRAIRQTHPYRQHEITLPASTRALCCANVPDTKERASGAPLL